MSANNIWTGTFWRATAERVLSTALQAAVPSITVASLSEIPWWTVFTIAGAAALLSLVKSVIAGINSGSPGLGTAEVLSEPGQVGESSDAGPVEVVPEQQPTSTPEPDLSRLDRLDGLDRREP